MNAKLFPAPIKQKILPPIDTECVDKPTRDRTADIGRLVREVHYKTDGNERKIRGTDGKFHRKVGKPVKIVSASKHFYICDNGNYPVCFSYDDEGREWEFVK